LCGGFFFQFELAEKWQFLPDTDGVRIGIIKFVGVKTALRPVES